MAVMSNRALAVAGVVALAVGFGGGFLSSQLLNERAAAESAAQEGKAFEWPFFGKLRRADAPRRGPEKPREFAVWRSRVDTSGVDPRACVELSRPLNPERSYGDFVQVNPDPGAPPAVSVDGGELCVAGLGFQDRRVTLLKGLPAADGSTLAQNADVDFAFGERPPFVGFAGDGVILPRAESDGLGIETVNVTRLRVEVWRVADRNLVRKAVAAPEPTAEGEYPSDWGEDSPDDEGRRVWSGELAVAGEQGRRTTTVFPLGAVLKELRPGAYVVKAKDASGGRGLRAGQADTEAEPGEDYDDNPPAQARRWVLFTDMALVAYDGSEALDVVVRSLRTAKPMGGIRVVLMARNGEELAETVTDGGGRVRFLRPLLQGSGAEQAKMVMAYGPEADFTALDLTRPPVDLSKQGVGGRIEDASAAAESAVAGREVKTPVDGYLYSDRGIYRPGETVHLVGLVRDREARAVADRKGAIVIRRPSGVEARRLRFTEVQRAGAVSLDFALPRTAPRGRWRATLEMDGLAQPAGEVSFAVEDFAPQRLAVTAEAREAEPVRAGETRRIDVTARFLYGAPGAGLTTQTEARLKADPDPFPRLEGFRFGDVTAPFQEKLVELGESVTDGEGRATAALDPAEAGEAAGPLVASVTAAVFEPGGRPVREGVTLKVRPKPLYLGLKVTEAEGERGRDPEQAFEVAAVDASGRLVAAPGVAWTLVSENWDYDWFQQDGRWQYRRTSRDAVVARGTVDVGAQPARFTRRLAWGDYRLELTQAATGARTVVRFASGWGAPAEDSTAPDAVRVTAGTRTYGQGDTVPITIKAPYGGEAQIAVATDRLIHFQNVTVPADGTTVRLKTDAKWGGGAYVLVTVVQPRDPARTPKPRRALGLVHVPLEPAGRKLDVRIGTPEKVSGRQQLEVPVQVSGAGLTGRARVTVAAVDQGILNLTRFESPDPVKWYFGKRALTLEYRDDYGRLLDPNLGAPANVNFGGDGVGGEGLSVTPIKTVALWSGVVETGIGGRAVVRLPAPDYNGELRIMAVAWTDDAVGSAEQKLVVREPVIAELALPRFLAPLDRAFATLELHNVEGRPGAYTAVINAVGGLTAPFRKVYELIVGQRIAERTPLTAPATAGVGRVDLAVTGPGFETRRSYPLQTRLGWGETTRTFTEQHRPGETYTPPPTLLRGLTAGTVRMTVSYSPFRGFDPAPVAASLARYPYGCTEQLVSTAYPHLYAGELSRDPKAKPVANAALQRAVDQVLDRQTLDGAIGLWRPGDGEADAWLGAYATDFLVQASQRGAAVPPAALERALAAMRQISRPDGWAPVSYRLEYPGWWLSSEAASKAATQRMRSRASAYALYVLAQGGRGDLARLRWWHDVQLKNEPSPLARAQVGAGLALMGDRARARSAFRQAVGEIGWRDPSDWYATPLRDTAAIVALAREAGEPRIADELTRRLELSVRDPDALNTQEQARLLQAAWWMLRDAGPVRIEAEGVTPLGPSGGVQRWAVGRLADARFRNAGPGALWRTVTITGTPTSAPPAEAQDLSAEKAIFALGGGRADLASLAQGDRVIVRISGRSDGSRAVPLVVDDALPAGWEIETVLGPEDGTEGPFRFLGELSAADVQEARDDRFIAALDLPGGRSYAVAYVARAVTPGAFFLPGAQVRDLYRPGVFARTAPGRVTIAAAG
jgi:alpha-2-macroglobulin